MHDRAPQPANSETADIELNVDINGKLRMETMPDCARFSLRCRPNSVSGLSKAFGCELPGEIGQTRISALRLALKLGPDEWQLYAPEQEAEPIVRAFADCYGDDTHSLVDISNREISLLVAGNHAALALRSGCAFDIEAMQIGGTTRTSFNGADIVLTRHEHEKYRVDVWRSFATHVIGILRAASREIEIGI